LCLKEWQLKNFTVFFIIIILAFAACGTKKVAVLSAPETKSVPVIERPVKPEEKQKPLVEMAAIHGGTFSMGSPKGTSFSLDIERPVSHVTVSDFLIGIYEITQGQYYEVTGYRPSNFSTNSDDSGPEGWMKLPVEMITWYNTLVFCNKLSVKEGFSPVYRIEGSTDPDEWGEAPLVKNSAWDAVEMISGANGYRLPTEAEWEYAARGGDTSSKPLVYAGSSDAGKVSWYYDNSGFKIHEIGKKAPNGYGLYDMSGNVMEWCWDWLGNYSAAAKDNPTGPLSGQYRIIRGGGWSVSVHYSRVAYRHNNSPFYRGVNLGFRTARSVQN